MTNTVDASALSGPCIKLDLEPDPRGQAETIVPYKWCFTGEAYDYLSEHPPTKPLWLVVVDHMAVSDDQHSTYERRFMHPIDKQNSGIGFLWGGNHRLTAFVVSGDEEDVREMLLKKRSRFEYVSTLFQRHSLPEVADGDERWPVFLSQRFDDSYDPDFGSPFCGLTLVGDAVSVVVSVSKDMFAKRPTGWRANYLNRLFSDDAEDVCKRRKRYPAYLLLPFWVVFGLLARTLLLLLSLLVSGHARWRELPRLFTGHIKRVFVSPDDLLRFDWYKIPGLYVVAAAALVAVGLNPAGSLPYLGVLAAGALLAFSGAIAGWLRTKRRDHKAAAKRVPGIYVPPMRVYAAMTCSSDTAKTIEVKPRPKRWWRVSMAFWRVKARQCKSYEVR